ncbi:MAG: peptidoglycan editing factor PgeF [Ignavibacteria bacterium]|jgi:YfiH family protein
MVIVKSSLFNNYEEIRFGFSTKIGLNRKPPFNFNLSRSVGDDDKIVDENRDAFLSCLGIEKENLVLQKQVHGEKIQIIDHCGFTGESDALITNKTNHALVISSADCPAIFIFDKTKKVIAAVHSGWRSTEKRILEKTLLKLKEEFDCNPNDLYSYISPSISQKNYEVGHEVSENFNEKYLRKSGGNFLLDLRKANKDMLLNFAIPESQIEVSELCTFESSQFLHSYRREGKVSGRAVGILMIEDNS